MDQALNEIRLNILLLEEVNQQGEVLRGELHQVHRVVVQRIQQVVSFLQVLPQDVQVVSLVVELEWTQDHLCIH